jgi:hypothetical protein
MIAVAVALALAGCVPRYSWTRADTTQADFDRDRARCAYEAESSTATYGSSTPTAYGLGAAIGQGIGIGIGRSMQNDRLMTLCMKAKGYGQVPLGYAGTGDPTSYGAVPVSSRPDIGQPVTAPIGAAPAVAGLKGESKFQMAAELLARSLACRPPTTAMTAKGAGQESFTISCPDGGILVIACDVDGCRLLR